MEFYDVLKSRRSIRSFADRKIEPEKIARLAESIYLAPSGCNRQPYRFLFIQDKSVLVQLYEAIPQKFVRQAPLLAVAMANRPLAWRMNSADDRSIGEIDLAIAVEHLVLAAAAENLGSCWMAYFDTKKVEKILNIAPPYCAEIIVPIGYPDETPGKFDRPVKINELVKVI